MKPSDFYFDINKYKDDDVVEPFDPEDIIFTFVPRVFYDANGYLEDHIDQFLIPVLYPLGFCDVVEGEYEYDGDPIKGEQELLKLGFVKKKLTMWGV